VVCHAAYFPIIETIFDNALEFWASKIRLHNTAMQLYYVIRNNERNGPYTGAQLGQMWRTGSVTADSLYCLEGSDDLRPILELAEKFDAHDNQSALAPNSADTTTFKKSKLLLIAGGLIAVLLVAIALIAISQTRNSPLAIPIDPTVTKNAYIEM